MTERTEENHWPEIYLICPPAFGHVTCAQVGRRALGAGSFIWGDNYRSEVKKPGRFANNDAVSTCRKLCFFISPNDHTVKMAVPWWVSNQGTRKFAHPLAISRNFALYASSFLRLWEEL